MKKIRFLSVLLVFTLLLAGCSQGGNGKTLTPAEAKERLDKLYGRLSGVETLVPRVDGSAIYDDDAVLVLPDISAYPFVVNPITDNFVTVYAALENQGLGYKAWLIEAVEAYNKSGAQVNGVPVSIGLRDIPSGLGSDFILQNKYTPDLYMPDSSLWGDVLTTRGISLTEVSSSVVGNVSGVIVNNKKSSVTDFRAVVDGVVNNTLLIGYTNPTTDSAGFNFALSVLKTFDDSNPFSDLSLQQFRVFQDNITYVAYEQSQLRNSAMSGVLDGFVADLQTYNSVSDLKSSYTFIPFGVKQDVPAYLVGDVSSLKQEIAKDFITYCGSSTLQQSAASRGFNGLPNHSSSFTTPNSAVVANTLEAWKQEKNGTRDITAVFIADVSGSMEGEPMLMLKAGLNRASSVIDSNANIGLVTFSDKVTVNVPIAKFDGTQRAYFASAVRNMTAGGGTAMYDAIITAHKILLDAKANNPNTKLMLFVLTDGDANRGFGFDDVAETIRGLQIPVYTIKYNEDVDGDVLKKIAGINEATAMDASNDDIIHKLQNLFNSQI